MFLFRKVTHAHGKVTYRGSFCSSTCRLFALISHHAQVARVPGWGCWDEDMRQRGRFRPPICPHTFWGCCHPGPFLSILTVSRIFVAPCGRIVSKQIILLNISIFTARGARAMDHLHTSPVTHQSLLTFHAVLQFEIFH